MIIKSTFKYTTSVIIRSNNIVIIHRSIATLRNSSLLSCQIQGTYLTMPQKLMISKRFMWKKAIDKGKECVGDNCKEALKAMTTVESPVNPNNASKTPTPSVSATNAVAQNSGNSTSITGTNTPADKKPTMPEMAPVITYGHTSSIEKATSQSNAQEQSFLDKVKKQKFNTEDSKSTSTDNVKNYVVKQTTTKKPSVVSDTTDNTSQDLNNNSTSSSPIGKPITNEVLQQQIGSLKKTSFLIERGVEQGYLKYSDGPGNPNAGKIKLTPEGNLRYKEQTQEKNGVEIQKATTPIDLSDKELKTGTVYIGEQTEITRPDQEHLVVTSNDGKILIWGYLTSNENNNTIQIAEKQIYETANPKGELKPQYFKPFEQPIKISPDKFIEHPEGSQYVQDLQISKNLKIAIKPACQNEPIPYNDTGLTKEDLEALTYKVVEENESKSSNFYDDDKKKKKKSSEEAAKKNQDKQKKEAQEKKAKAKLDAENKSKSINNDE